MNRASPFHAYVSVSASSLQRTLGATGDSERSARTKRLPVGRNTVVRALVLAACLAYSADAFAQRIIYDQSRDKNAQDASAAAKDVTAGSLFSKMLANADAQAKREADTQMAFLEQQMRAKVEAFSSWYDPKDRVASVLPGNMGILEGTCRSVRCELESLRIKVNFFLGIGPASPEDIAARLKALDAKKKELEDALKELQAAAKNPDPAVVRAFALLEDPGKDLVAYGKQFEDVAKANNIAINQGIVRATQQISDGLDETIAVYKVTKGIWDGYKAVDVDPASLRPRQETIDLQLLAIEQDHLKTLTRIGVRQSVDAAYAMDRIDTALARLKAAALFDSTAKIEDTLRSQLKANDREGLRATLDILHEATAAVAQQDGAGRLAQLREADEERRVSIRRSAVNSSAYDSTIQLAAQRLALYWKSGAKPGDLAQLAFYITNTIAIPAIALK
jgi:hypothetical protein